MRDEHRTDGWLDCGAEILNRPGFRFHIHASGGERKRSVRRRDELICNQRVSGVGWMYTVEAEEATKILRGGILAIDSEARRQCCKVGGHVHERCARRCDWLRD